MTGIRPAHRQDFRNRISAEITILLPVADGQNAPGNIGHGNIEPISEHYPNRVNVELSIKTRG